MNHHEPAHRDPCGRPLAPLPRAGRHRPHVCEDLGSLVSAAAHGDERAWSALVRRLEPAVRAVARRHRLGDADQDEVVQHTWIRLVVHIDSIRDAAALPGWLTTTARRESLRLLSARRDVPVEELQPAETLEAGTLDEQVLDEERRAALHCALDALPPRQRALMRTLVARPALTYDQLSAALGLPKGSIGPTRQRSLARLRRDPHLREAVAR
jgi:RNA polymerase sigma factor (sigma-70 family)